MKNVDLDGPGGLAAETQIEGLPDHDSNSDDPSGSDRGIDDGPESRPLSTYLLIAVFCLGLLLVIAVVARSQLAGDSDSVQADATASSAGEPGQGDTTDGGGALQADGTQDSIGSSLETEQPSTDSTADTTSQDEADSTEASSGATDGSSTSEVPAAAPTSDAPISVVGMSSLSNVRLRTNRAAYRFTADRDGSIESMRLYFIVNTSRSGYAAGSGGSINVTVAPEGSDGLPDESCTMAGRFQATFGLVDGAYSGADRGQFIKDSLLGGWDFSEPISVEAGEKYFIIFDNADPSPANNFVSLDLVIDLIPDSAAGQGPIPSPARRTDFSFFEDREGQAWFQADEHSSGHWRTPIFQVEYADGGTQGQGFMQYEARNAFELSGSSAIRTTIELGQDRTVSELAARVASHPSAPVILELTTIDGEVLRSVTAPASGTINYRGAVWAEGTVEPLTLKAGAEYALVVRAGSGYSGSIVPLQAGLTYGFTADSVFPFGRAQTSPDGKDWSDWRNGLFYQSISVK